VKCSKKSLWVNPNPEPETALALAYLPTYLVGMRADLVIIKHTWFCLRTMT